MAPHTAGNKALQEVDWERLDKTKFFFVGAGVFSGVTTCLYPISVIKTRQMAMPNVGGGVKGALQTTAAIWKSEGIPGYYRGFGTVVGGMLPARMMYLNVLEMSKSGMNKVGHYLDLSEPTTAALSSGAAGAAASLSSQIVTVPIEVVSQRQIMHGVDSATPSHTHKPASNSGPPTNTSISLQPSSAAAPVSTSGTTLTSSPRPTQPTSPATANTGSQADSMRRLSLWTTLRRVLAEEGVKGLYRGFGLSVLVYVPNGGLWWGFYGLYQRLLWNVYDPQPLAPHHEPVLASTTEVVAIQTISALAAGCTSAFLTTPLDLIKTRVQLARKTPGQKLPTSGEVVRQIWADEGSKGLLRGLAPRMFSGALWGTAMVSAYEFVKRICAMPVPDERNS